MNRVTRCRSGVADALLGCAEGRGLNVERWLSRIALSGLFLTLIAIEFAIAVLGSNAVTSLSRYMHKSLPPSCSFAHSYRCSRVPFLSLTVSFSRLRVVACLPRISLAPSCSCCCSSFVRASVARVGHCETARMTILTLGCTNRCAESLLLRLRDCVHASGDHRDFRQKFHEEIFAQVFSHCLLHRHERSAKPSARHSAESHARSRAPLHAQHFDPVHFASMHSAKNSRVKNSIAPGTRGDA